MKTIISYMHFRYIILLGLTVLMQAPAGLHAQCNEVDLQAVSIDPALPQIGKGQTTTITVVMKNNGTCTIPVGDATVQVTFSALALELGNPVNFRDNCGQWTYLGAVSNAKQHNLFFINKGGPIPGDDKTCSFHFDVKGKTASPNAVAITLASSLAPEAKTGDVNGSNQSAATEIYITANAVPLRELVTDFSARTNECDALLSWKAEDSRIEKTEVEYGPNEAQFAVVGPGKTNPATGTGEYTHYQGNGKGYYRLKITEKNGSISHSKVISVETKCVVKKGFNP